MKSFFPALAAAVGMAAVGVATAATTTANLNVSGSIGGACSVSTTPLNFGSFNSIPSPINVQTTLSVTCTNGTPYNVAMDGGLQSTNPGGSGFRRLRSAVDPTRHIKYLITKTSVSGEWGDNGFGSTYTDGTPVAGTGSGAAQALTVFARTQYNVAGADGALVAGGYADTVTVTVHF